jgi:hypothetical protein
MPYRSSGGLFVLGSAVMLVMGLFSAAKNRRWYLIGSWLAFLIGWPFCLYAISQIPDPHLRLWVLVPAIMGWVPWIASGPIVYGMATRPKEQLWGDLHDQPPVKAIRIRGIVALAIGAVAWIYGVSDPTLSGGRQALVLAVMLYGLLLGLYWSLTGRKM